MAKRNISRIFLKIPSGNLKLVCIKVTKENARLISSINSFHLNLISLVMKIKLNYNKPEKRELKMKFQAKWSVISLLYSILVYNLLLVFYNGLNHFSIVVLTIFKMIELFPVDSQTVLEKCIYKANLRSINILLVKTCLTFTLSTFFLFLHIALSISQLRVIDVFSLE